LRCPKKGTFTYAPIRENYGSIPSPIVLIAFLSLAVLASILSYFVLRPFGDAGIEKLEIGEAPNIVLISIDSLRADHLHCYGYNRKTSPFMDSLAAEGVLFKNVYSTTSWTLPSHLSMLPGHQKISGILTTSLNNPFNFR